MLYFFLSIKKPKKSFTFSTLICTLYQSINVQRRYAMQKIQLSEDIQPLSEFRANVTSFIEKVKKTKRPLVITQRGKSAAVMMDVLEYEKLIDKLELLTDIQLAESQLKNNEGLSHEDAKDKVLGKIRK